MIFFLVSRSVTTLWSGPYLDRWNRKVVMIASEWIRSATFLMVLVLHLTHLLEVWHLVIVQIVIGVAAPLYQPSSMAYVAQILQKEQLRKANSLIDSTAQTMMIMGPFLSGILLYVLGINWILVFLILTMTISGFLLFFLQSADKKNDGPTKEKWFPQFKEGLAFYKHNRFLFWMAMLLVILNICKGAFFPMFLPYITEIIGGSTFHFGLFESFFAVGLISGTLAVGLFKRPKNLRNVMLGSVIIDGMVTSLLGWSTIFPVALLFVMISGFCMPIMTVNNTTLYQQHVPQHLMGRVFSVRIFLTTIGTPLGAFLGGVISEFYGIGTLFGCIGGLMIFSSFLAFFLPSLKEVDHSSMKSDEVVPSV